MNNVFKFRTSLFWICRSTDILCECERYIKINNVYQIFVCFKIKIIKNILKQRNVFAFNGSRTWMNLYGNETDVYSFKDLRIQWLVWGGGEGDPHLFYLRPTNYVINWYLRHTKVQTVCRKGKRG